MSGRGDGSAALVVRAADVMSAAITDGMALQRHTVRRGPSRSCRIAMPMIRMHSGSAGSSRCAYGGGSDPLPASRSPSAGPGALSSSALRRASSARSFADTAPKPSTPPEAEAMAVQ
jgi:hypothetical protein